MTEQPSTEPHNGRLWQSPTTVIVSSLLVLIGACVFYYGGDVVTYLKQLTSSEPTKSIIINTTLVLTVGITLLSLLNITSSYLVKRKVRAVLKKTARTTRSSAPIKQTQGRSQVLLKSGLWMWMFLIESFLLQSMWAAITILPFLLLILLFSIVNSSTLSIQVRVAGNSFLVMFLVLNFIHWLDVKTKSRL